MAATSLRRCLRPCQHLQLGTSSAHSLAPSSHHFLGAARAFAAGQKGKRLEGKVGIVTGASSGIGRAIAQALDNEGMKVVLLSRSGPKVEEAASQMSNAVGMSCDVTSRSSVHEVVADVMKQHKQVDLVVNCAGVMYFTLFRNLHYDEWDETINTNCKGVVNMCGAVMPHMMKAKTGHIVNISSDAAKQIFPALAVYNASKAFAATFSKSLRAECVGTGIRVTDVQPGDTATNLIMKNTDPEAAGKVGVDIGQKIGGGFERASLLDPEDVADAVIYAVTVPNHVGLHEILIEPRDQMFGDPTAMGVAPDGMYGPAATGPDPKE